MRDSILAGLEMFVQGVLRRGGDGELSFGKPLKRVPKGLPPGAAEFFTTVASRVRVRWHLDDAVGDGLPDEFEECRAGELDLHPKCFEVVASDWTVSDDPVWAGKAVFAPDGSGDYLGIDATGRVFFLSHDLDEPHGRQLATSLTDLLERWAPLGCVGPAGVAMSPFLTRTRLSCRGPAARRFLRILGGDDRDWKAAKRARTKRVAARSKAVAQDSAVFEKFIEALTDKRLDKKWRAHHAYVVDMVERCYGRAPSPALRTLLMHTPGKEVGAFLPEVPGATITSWDNAFVQAQSDVLLLCGALTNTWPIGKSYLVEVQPGADQVSVRRPLLGFAGVVDSLQEFARQLALKKVRRNTAAEGDESSSPTTRAASLAEPSAMLRALFENYAVYRHVHKVEPQPQPANLRELDCASALRALWMSYLSGVELSLAEAKEHPAELVSGAAVVIESLLDGRDARNPANFLHAARDVCMGEASWPAEHEDPQRLVNTAYGMQKEGRWDEMLAVADEMIDGGLRLDHAWPYRVRALQGLERHEDVLEAADTALLFCELGKAALFGAKVTSLAALGEHAASEAHVWWCSPHYRLNTLKR